MSRGEVITKFIQITFAAVEGQGNANFLDSLYLTSNFKTVRDVVSNLTAGASDVGIDKVIKLGAAATAVTVSAAAIHQLHEWITVKDIEEKNGLKLQIPKKKEKLFHKEVDKGIMTQLQNRFEDLSLHVEDIIGEDSESDNGSKVVKMLEDIRVSSVQTCEGGSELGAVGTHVKGGKYEAKHENHVSLIRANGGTAIGFLAGGGADVKIEKKGGVDMVGDFDGEDYDQIRRMRRGMDGGAEDEYDTMLIKVIGDGLEETFKGRFKPTALVFDIKTALKKKEKRIFSLSFGGKQLEEDKMLKDVPIENGNVLKATEIKPDDSKTPQKN